MARSAAERIVPADERYGGREPLGRRVGQRVTIRELATLIANPTGFAGDVRWDPTKPDGQPRHFLGASHATDRFGFTARTTFAAGLDRTIRADCDSLSGVAPTGKPRRGPTCRLSG